MICWSAFSPFRAPDRRVRAEKLHFCQSGSQGVRCVALAYLPFASTCQWEVLVLLYERPRLTCDSQDSRKVAR